MLGGSMTTTTKPASRETNPADPYGEVRPNGALGVLAVPDHPSSHGTGRETIRPDVIATDFSASRPRYVVSVEEYVRFHEQGFLVVRGLLNEAEIAELREHGADLMHGRVAVPGIEPPTPDMTLAEIESRYLRIHMLHRHLEIEERYLLHPRVLDVLEALIGPDLLALQTMYFIKAPGGAGQGYHQDSYYIPTYPDTLCGRGLQSTARMRRTGACGSRLGPNMNRSTQLMTASGRTTPTWATSRWWRT